MLMKRLALLAIGLALAAPAHAQKAPPVPDLLKRALVAPASKAIYAYDFETVSTNVDPKKGPLTTTTRGHIDPSRKKGDRVTITFVEGVSGDGKPINAKKMDENLEKASDGKIFCDTASRENVTNVVDKGATADGHLFTFTPSAEPDTDGEMKEILKKMQADAVVDEASGLLKSFEGRLLKKHSVMLIAEVKSASMKMECAPAPNGRSYTARTEFTGLISAFGNTFDTKSVQTISNITPVG
jgi:hypothetical protein